MNSLWKKNAHNYCILLILPGVALSVGDYESGKRGEAEGRPRLSEPDMIWLARSASPC